MKPFEAAAISAQFTIFGEAATYTPFGGGPVNLKAILRVPTETDNLLTAGTRRPSLTADVRFADVATRPPANSILTINGVTRRILNAEPDEISGTWRLDLASEAI